jgi:selenocysteine lyase/cysteine desulfurase
MQAFGMSAVERHGLALRNRAYEQLTRIKRLRIVSPPPGPLTTAIIACVLPDDIDSRALRDTMLAKHQIIVKMSEQRQFIGFRLSPHVLNDEAQIDAALKSRDRLINA